MERGEIEEKTREILVDQLGVEPNEVTLGASLIDDLSADSLDRAELIIRFEDDFKIEIPDEDAGQLATVKDVVNYVIRKLANQS